jgi:hypothetical protein
MYRHQFPTKTAIAELQPLATYQTSPEEHKTKRKQISKQNIQKF